MDKAHPAEPDGEEEPGHGASWPDSLGIAVLVLDLGAPWAAATAAGIDGRAPEAPAPAVPARQGTSDSPPLQTLSTAVDHITIRGANGRARALFRAKAAWFSTRRLRRHLRRPEVRPVVQAAVRALWRGETLFEGEIPAETADGRPLTLVFSLTVPGTARDAGAVPVYLINRSEAARREAQSRRREDHFRQAFQHASHGMALIGAEGRWLRVNAALCAMLGHTEAALRASTLQDICHSQDRADNIAWMTHVRAHPDTRFARETRYLRRDGSVLWVHVTGSMLAPRGGEAPVLIAQIQNIDPHKRAEAALVESEERFRSAVEYAGHGIAILSVEGHFQQVNRAFRETTGYTADLLSQLTLKDLTPELDWDDEARRLQAVLDGRDRSYTLRKRMLHFLGHAVPMRVTAALVRGSGGMPLSLVYQILDETEQHEAEARARRAETHLLDAFETLSDDILLFDSTDRLVLVNTKFKHAFPGLADILVPGARFVDIIRRIDALGLVTDGDGTASDWMAWRLDHFRRRAGEPFEVKLGDGRWFLVRGSRTAEGSTLILRSDITEMKRREAALADAKLLADRANRAKSEFLANMSHELRTPLNAINGFSELLLKEVFGPLGAPVYSEYLGNILAAGQHLLSLIDDILDLARIEDRAIQLQDRLVDVAALTETCIGIIEHRAHGKDITVANAVSPSLPFLRGDGQRLRQVLLNLLTNAVKFTQRGGLVTVHGRRARSGHLLLSVSDNGIGMSAQDIQIALSRFGQVESVFTRHEGGTGLGLPLCRALMEAHGGTLDIISQSGEGTTVTLRFPASRAMPMGTLAPPASETEPPSSDDPPPDARLSSGARPGED
ncbi:PAS domain-containing sensor histidine kinase [Roseospira visakhapatnamensis]|uniref:histidine kinase n=1 Tax=Roseospira visakhapatnamensis TaxID=390880 RepID=A0A7W6RDV3_9PROT|nr:PAS domain S-box protein [Roseospira visakhapatnamensis]MBB4266204.1 two-component system cell cycle sensor histidine kinase PleC [Roseospira visakhapatnamensis]